MDEYVEIKYKTDDGIKVRIRFGPFDRAIDDGGINRNLKHIQQYAIKVYSVDGPSPRRMRPYDQPIWLEDEVGITMNPRIPEKFGEILADKSSPSEAYHQLFDFSQEFVPEEIPPEEELREV